MSPKEKPAAAESAVATVGEGERDVIITRVFDVPARILFRAHSAPEHVLRWFGPVGYPLDLCEMDFRVGGKYRFAMRGPDGARMTAFGGEYLDIVPNQKIRYTNTMEIPGAETMIVTITFAEADGRTTLTMHTLFGSAQQKRDHVARGYLEGVSSGLDQLNTVVAEMA